MSSLLLIPLLFLIPYLGQYIYSPGSQYSDLLISHIPNAIFLRDSLFQYGQVPLWSNTILSGYPFAADPLSGLWYPPGWIGIFLPIPFGFNLAILIHLLFGGYGMFRFLKAEGISTLPALLGGMLFEAMPKVIAHLAAGHVTLLYAISWTPWLLLLEHHSRKYKDWRRFILGPGIILGVIFLADPRWAAYAGILWGIYSLALFTARRVVSTDNDPKRAQSLNWTKDFLPWIGRIGAQIVIAALIAAPLLVPLLQYTALSTRAHLTASDVLTLSLPPNRLLGLLFPTFGGSVEWVDYFTGAGIVLLIFGIIQTGTRKIIRFWGYLFIGYLIFSLGSFIPGMGILAQIPGFSLLRVPPRMLFIAGFALAVLVAKVFDTLIKSPPTAGDKPRFSPNIILVGLSGFVDLLAIGVWVISKDFPLNFMWGAVSITVITILIILKVSNIWNGNKWAFSFLAIVVVDLIGVNWPSISPKIKPIQPEGREEIIATIKALGQEPFRVYSPSYSIPQDLAAAAHLELADGIDPLQLASYWRYMQNATGVNEPGYSVTLPALKTGDPEEDNRYAFPNAEMLGKLNVRYIVAEYPLNSKVLSLQKQIGNTYLYSNNNVYSRAWINSDSGQITHKVQDLKITPNRITLQAQGPGNLSLSEMAYPGWVATVDNTPAIIYPSDGIIRSIQIPDGNHFIKFEFQPWWVFLGIGAGLLTWITVILFIISNRKR